MPIICPNFDFKNVLFQAVFFFKFFSIFCHFDPNFDLKDQFKEEKFLDPKSFLCQLLPLTKEN